MILSGFDGTKGLRSVAFFACFAAISDSRDSCPEIGAAAQRTIRIAAALHKAGGS